MKGLVRRLVRNAGVHSLDLVIIDQSGRSDVYAYDGANRLLSLDTTVDDGTGPSTTSGLLDWDDLGGVIGDH